MIQYEKITPEIAEEQWERYRKGQRNDSNWDKFFGKRDNFFGKLVVWCQEREKEERLPEYRKKGKKEPIKKYLSRKYHGVKPMPHINKCAKLYRVVHAERFPALTQTEYDLLVAEAVEDFNRELKRKDITNEEVKQMLKHGVCGSDFLNRKSKDEMYPRGGFIYLMAISSEPNWCKLGGSQRNPRVRSSELDATQRAFPGSLTLHAWSVEVSDWKKAELALQAPFVNGGRKGRDYFQINWEKLEEVIEHGKRVGKQFAKGIVGRVARDYLASL